MALGIGVFGTLSDRLVTRNMASGAKHRPEIRLTPWFTLPAGFALPSGLFIYGWTIQYHVHWIVPMIGQFNSPRMVPNSPLTRPIGVVIFAFGLMGIMMCVQNYLLDVYPRHAASVTAAMAVLRSLMGALLPLCALDMYAALDMGWGNSLLAFLSLGLVPIPLLFYKFGPSLVKRFPVDM
jgi:MFS family permease